MLGDVLIDRHPLLALADLLAAHADREQPLHLPHLLLQRDDALARLEPRRQLVGVDRLGHEIVDAGVERLEDLLLARLRGEQEHVGVDRPVGRTQPAAQFEPVDVGHAPVGHQQRDFLSEQLPERRPAAVDCHRLVTALAHDVFDDRTTDGIVVRDQYLHVLIVPLSAALTNGRAPRPGRRSGGRGPSRSPLPTP